jgi:hypothetical protein
MSRDIGHSRRHVSCSCRRVEDRVQTAHRDRGGGRVRILPTTSSPAPGPLPGRWPGRGRTTLAGATHQSAPIVPRDRGADRAAANRADLVRARRRPDHHRLAPRAREPASTVDLHDPPHPAHRWPDHPRTAETTPLLLPPIPSRATQRDLAIRLHPLAPGRRHRHRDPELARRPRPLPAVGHRPPPTAQSPETTSSSPS